MKKSLLLAAVMMSVSVFAQKVECSRDFAKADRLCWASDLYNIEKSFDGRFAEFDFTVSQDGWYSIVYDGGFNGLIYVNGKFLRKGSPSLLKREKGKSWYKNCNVWLNKGKNTVRLYSPSADWKALKSSSPWLRTTPKTVQLVSSGSEPAGCVFARKLQKDVVRTGEDFTFEMTSGGTGTELTYELYHSVLTSEKPEEKLLRTVVFSASQKPETRIVRIPCDKEGVFKITGKVKDSKGKLITVFDIGAFAAVDVNGFKSNPLSKQYPVIDIDCVKQTLNGKPLPKNKYFEANGPTQVVTTKAGTYRESHDSSEPLAPPMKTADSPASFSGFSYHIDLPAEQVPYLIDVEFPDDSRRNVAIYTVWLDENNVEVKQKYPSNGCEVNNSYGKAYRTGGPNAFSNKMQHHRILVWAASKRLCLPVITQEFGTRAAISRITVYRFEKDELPITKGTYDNGRMVGQWSEEAGNWRMFVNPPQIYKSAWARTLVAMDRWAQYCRFNGTNTIGGLGISYRNVFWRSNVFYSCQTWDLDEVRMMCLVCEKYGMYYIPDLFRASEVARMTEFPVAAKNPDDVYSFGLSGEKVMGLSGNGVNPLHPAVQDFWVRGMKELGGLLNDSPAFRGVSARSNSWFFSSDFHFSTLCWGYSDWLIAQFEKDTGIKVPVAANDPEKYMKRYLFLTNGDMKAKWIAWRAEGIRKYWIRLRDALRGDTGRKDIFFSTAGNMKTDENGLMAENVLERMAEAGVSMDMLKNEDGIVYTADGVLPKELRQLKFPSASGSPSLGLRELGKGWAKKQMGIDISKINVGYGSTVFVPAGRNSLSSLARNLADCDAMYFRYGSNSDHTGDPMLWRPWITAYEKLPAESFRDVCVKDPLFVRSLTRKTGLFGYETWFYVVNRGLFPIKAEIKLPGITKLMKLGVQDQEIVCKDSKLTLELPPCDLAVFKAPEKIKFGAVSCVIPACATEAARAHLAYVQNQIVPGATAKFKHDISDPAWTLMKRNSLSRLEQLLSSDEAKKEYFRQAKMPAWADMTMFPGKLVKSNAKGHWNVPEPYWNSLEMAAFTKSAFEKKDSRFLNKNWVGDTVLWTKTGVFELDLNVRGDAVYTLRIGFAGEKQGVFFAEIDGKSTGIPYTVSTAKIPDYAAWELYLKSGHHKLTLRTNGGLALYALQLVPKLRPITNASWSTIGPFDLQISSSEMWSGKKKNADEIIHNTLMKKYPPEVGGINLKGTYKNEQGTTLRWTQISPLIHTPKNDGLVPFMMRTKSPGAKMNLAVTWIVSDTERDVAFSLGTEWWGEAFLNGQRVLSDVPASMKAQAEFNTTTPRLAVLHLKKGVNELLVKIHGGSFLSYFSAEISDLNGMKFYAVKP